MKRAQWNDHIQVPYIVQNLLNVSICIQMYVRMCSHTHTQWWTDKYVRLQVGIGHFDASMSFILGCCEKLLTLNCRIRVGVMIYPLPPLRALVFFYAGQRVEQRVEHKA